MESCQIVNGQLITYMDTRLDAVHTIALWLSPPHPFSSQMIIFKSFEEGISRITVFAEWTVMSDIFVRGALEKVK